MKVTQHYQDYDNADVGDDEDHLEAPHCPILDVNVANNNASIHQSKNVSFIHFLFCLFFLQVLDKLDLQVLDFWIFSE